MKPEKLETADPIGSAVLASRRPRMSQHEMCYMFSCCAKLPAIWLVANEKITARLFHSDEAKYVLIWRSFVRTANGNGGMLPTDSSIALNLVAMNVSAEIATDPQRLYYTPTVEQTVLGDGDGGVGLLEELFMLPVNGETVNTGYDLLAKFLTERFASDVIHLAFAGLSQANDVIGDPATVVEVMEKHVREISGIGTDPGSDAFISGQAVLPSGRKIITTTIRWLDALMGGGQAKKEVYAVLGPTGGGKTCLGSQIAIEGALFQAVLATQSTDNAGYWYFFTYELNEAELRSRMYAYSARIHHEVFTKKRRSGVLTTSERPETLDEYERDPFVNAPGNPLRGEQERLRDVDLRMSGINSRLRIVDYSGDKRGCGQGYVPEIASYLGREKAMGRSVAGIVIDYAGIVVSRYIAAKNLNPSVEYSLLKAFVDNIKTYVARQFDTPCWILHQLSGAAANRPAGAKTHHSEASGCRNFADNTDYAIQLTNYNKNDGMTIVHCTKHRWSAGVEDGMVVRFDGRFGAFRDPDQEYVWDNATKRIVPREFLNSLGIGMAPAIQRGGTRHLPPVDPTDGI